MSTPFIVVAVDEGECVLTCPTSKGLIVFWSTDALLLDFSNQCFSPSLPCLPPTSDLKTTEELKEIHWTATPACSSPSAPLLETGTIAGALDVSFSNDSWLEIWFLTSWIGQSMTRVEMVETAQKLQLQQRQGDHLLDSCFTCNKCLMK